MKCLYYVFRSLRLILEKNWIMTFFPLNFLSKFKYMYRVDTVLSLILLVSERLKIPRTKVETNFLKKINFVTNKWFAQDAFGKYQMTTENLSKQTVVWEYLCAQIFLSSGIFQKARRFYLTGGITNRYPFIWGLLEQSFSESYFCDASLLIRYKFIAFKFFSWKVLIISYKTSIITVIFNEQPNELEIYVKLCQKVTIFYQKEQVSLFQMQEKLRVCENSK